MAAGTDDGRVAFFDTHSGRRRGPATKMAGAASAQLAISPDGRLLAVSALDAAATVWDIRSRTRIGDAFPVAKGEVPAVAFEPRGRLLITRPRNPIQWPAR